MRILAISKYPPIQGGTASRCYFHYRLLAQAGHRVVVVTNAADVEPAYRCHLIPGDRERLEAEFPSGGEVRVVFTDGRGVDGQFIPAGDAAVTRLVSLAVQIHERFRPDVIFGSYLEPYGMAAAVTAGWIGTPYMIEHAGSDRTRLLANPELGPALARVLRGAAVCFSADRSLAGFGVAPDRIIPVPVSYLPTDLFSPAGDDLTGLDLSSLGMDDRLIPPVPVVGVYGKVGPTKGSFDLLAALGQLRQEGVPFELAAMVGGRALSAFERELEDRGLATATRRLPFLCPWRVPAFLRSCDLVCFLERDFPVRIHGPKVAREVLATGRCLVVSEEIRRKQRHPGRFIDGKNAVIVRDPREVSDLAEKLRRALLDPEWTSAVGRAGHELFEPVDPDLLVESYEAAFERAGRLQTPVCGQGSAPSAEVSRENDVLLRDEYPASHAVLTAATSDIKFTDCVAACGATRVDVALLRAADGLGQDVPAWWADILRYDAGRAWLREEPYWPVPRHEPERPDPGGLRNRDWLDLYPMLQVPVKTMEFGTPVHDAEGALRGGVHPGAFKPVARATTLMFVKSGDLLGRTYQVSGAVATLIPLLDGSRPIREICDLAAVDPDDLAKLLDALKAENALRLHPSAQSRPMFPDDP